jgi:pimeloyl-ACP methyl ester carboxylesterase
VWGVEEYGRFVQLQITNYKLQIKSPNTNVVILGHSFGGQVLAHLISHNPTICDGAIFAASSIVREDFLIKRTALGLVAKVGKGIFLLPGLKQFSGLAKKILYRASDSPDYQKTSGIQRDIYKKIIRQDQTACLDSISLPSLVVWGDKDRMTPLKYGTMIVKRLKQATFVVIPNGTHGLHLETKQKLLDAVSDFCSTVG